MAVPQPLQQCHAYAALTVGGLVAQPEPPVLGAPEQARVVAAILNATPATPPDPQLVLSDVLTTAVGHVLHWQPVSDLPASVHAG